MDFLQEKVFEINGFEVLWWMLIAAVAAILLIIIMIVVLANKKAVDNEAKEIKEEVNKVEVTSVQSQEVEKNPEIKEVTETPTKTVEEETKEADTKSQRSGRYHVSKRAEDGKWQVKRENSERVLKILDTQAEAVAYAKVKANNQSTNVVIHKVDGKIRKQKY